MKKASQAEPQAAEKAAPAVAVIQADPAVGLTEDEAAQRRAAGLDNRAVEAPGKSEKQIIRENVCTYFNLVFAVLSVCLALVGSFANMSFLLLVACNTAIGIIQQIHAKRTVDQLTLVAAHKVRCVRGGVLCEVRPAELVRDDIVEFAAGEQICADAVLCSGQAQLNEALITGEADAVEKQAGDALRSGSFVVSGRCRARLTRVGADSYASRLTLEAKKDVRVGKGEMMRSLDRLIQFIGIVLVPMGTVLFFKQYEVLGLTLRDSVESTVAALIGMIPEGLYLLTSVALSVSMMRLAQKKVLAQDMNCIETLARVDVLCVDKTGTITEPGMAVRELICLDDAVPAAQAEQALRAFYAGTQPDNDTARAMAERFAGKSEWHRESTVPFDSAYKWSAATFTRMGSYIVGAPEFVLGKGYGAWQSRIEPYQAAGCRVLLAARYAGTPDPKAGLDSAAVRPVALITLSNRIRPEAEKTFRYFKQAGVSVRVISGDNPVTVSEVARQAGVADAECYVDAASLKTDEDITRAAAQYTVFGRVTPEQKRKLVHALQAAGHTVAMTGDGVNDVLALKDADCGIAMGSGAQAAEQVAKLVLLDSDFAGLPAVVAEGRCVINNIERSAALYLVKNIFSFLLSVLSLFWTMPYPLQPLQLTLISFITIGVPSFVLALEPNHDPIRGKFMRNVLRQAFPGGLTNLGLILGVEAFAYAFDLSGETLYTIATVVLLAVGLLVLYEVSKPFDAARGVLLGGMTVLAVLSVTLGHSWFELSVLDLQGALVLAVFLLLALPVMRFVLRGFEYGDALVAKLTQRRAAYRAKHKAERAA